MRIAPQVVLTREQRAKLEAYARGRRTPARVVLRARIVLLAAEGKQDLKIARLLSIVPRTAARVFCAPVSQGWSTTPRDLAARLPSHRISCG
jgi:hypothetical protein